MNPFQAWAKGPHTNNMLSLRNIQDVLGCETLEAHVRVQLLKDAEFLLQKSCPEHPLWGLQLCMTCHTTSQCLGCLDEPCACEFAPRNMDWLDNEANWQPLTGQRNAL